MNSKLVKLIKVVTRMSNFPRFVTHKFDVLLDVFDVLNVLLQWVGIIESKVAFASWHLRLHEVKPHSFRVTNMKISVRFWRESSQDNLSKLFVSCIQNLFWVQWWLHLSTNQLRNVFNVEFLLLSCLGTFFLLFNCLFRSFLFLINCNIFRKSFCFPYLLEQIFESFTFNKGKFLFDFDKEINFFGFLVGISNILLNNVFNFLWSKFHSNTTIFEEFL